MVAKDPASATRRSPLSAHIAALIGAREGARRDPAAGQRPPISASSTREFFWGSTQRDGAAERVFVYT